MGHLKYWCPAIPFSSRHHCTHGGQITGCLKRVSREVESENKPDLDKCYSGDVNGLWGQDGLILNEGNWGWFLEEKRCLEKI